MNNKKTERFDLFAVMVLSCLISFVAAALLDRYQEPTFTLHGNNCPSLMIAEARMDTLEWVVTENLLQLQQKTYELNEEAVAKTWTINYLMEELARCQHNESGESLTMPQLNKDDWQ